MPRAQPLRDLLESLTAPADKKALTGTIADPQKLLESQSVAALDERHAGSYVLFVYDSRIDTDLSAYLTSGALANDGGRTIFALYEPERPVAGSDELASLGIGELLASSPVVDFATTLIGSPRIVPGLLALGRLATPTTAVYVPLVPIAGRPIAGRVREILRFIGDATRPGTLDVLSAHALGESLGVRNIPYDSMQSTSPREAFSRMLGYLWAHKSDVVAVVKTAVALKTGAGGA